MAKRIDYAAVHADAWTIARRVNTFNGGFNSFRRKHPEVSMEESRKIWASLFARGQRVKYMQDSKQSDYLSKKKIGCPRGGNMMFYTHRVTFTDMDGNQREVHIHSLVHLAGRIGTTNNRAMDDVIRQLWEGRYFNKADVDISEHITSTQMLQVRCQTGSDR